MEESKLFRNIWRFNALAIAIASTLAIVVLVFAAYMIYKETNRSRHRNEVVNIDPESTIKETFRFGNVDYIQGSDSVIVPLYSDQKFDYRYSGGKSTVSTRNLLFSNMVSGTNKWLLPNNGFLISHYQLINESNSYERDKSIITILYYIVKSDTNSDERLTEKDDLTIAFSTPEGENYTEVLDGIETVLGYDVINKQTMAIVFNCNGRGYTAYINLDSHFKVAKEIPLPKIK